jgi:flagellar protein FlaF
MQQAHQAYSKNALQNADPRQLEAKILMLAASKLQAAKDDWENVDRLLLDQALTFNRRLWTFLVGGVLEEGNPLPVEIKANIANLANFIFKQTNSILLEPKPGDLDILITINCNVASGLRGEAEAAPESAGKAA